MTAPLHANMHTSPSSPAPASRPLRGDARVEFRWRVNGIGMDATNPLDVQDGMRGVQAWHPGSYWSGGYKDWTGTDVHGANLIFRGGTPNGRAVRCTSEVVPLDQAGLAVTFAIPLHVGLGTAERLSVALKVSGQGEEIVVLNLDPRRETHCSSGRFKTVFHLLRLDEAPKDAPGLGFAGMLHLRVYPLLLNYGNRMTFEFHSQTGHMDHEASLFVGSLWSDLSDTDPRAEWARSGLDEAALADARIDVRRRLDAWNEKALDLSRRLLAEAGRVEVSLASPRRPWDRGELRVQAYTGNPAKDVVAGKPNHHCVRMAEALTAALGRRLSLFRYQQWQPVVKEDDPRQLEPEGWGMLEQWMIAAERCAERVMLAFYLDAFLAAYLEFTRRGTLPLPPEGVPGHTWEHLRIGYVTAISAALRVCPRLRVVQMQYEFDNFSSAECHRDAHYRLFKTLYEAVHEINAALPAERRLEVAGLGINTPENRWDFIDGFLARFAADPDPRKRLDYLTWHTYLFPGSTPTIARGFGARLRALLEKHRLPADLIHDDGQVGLAEPSTIEDLSGLDGAARKEAAMACFTAALHHEYLKEPGRFIPVSGGGWHFGCLTFGRQSALSPYAKGMLLRSRLADACLDVAVSPQDPQTGYGLHGFATADDVCVRALVWTISPTIFMQEALPLRYPQAELVLRDLPASCRGRPLRVTVHTSDPEDAAVQAILGAPKCQTLPITRGAGERYQIDFTDEEVAALDAIPTRELELVSHDGVLRVPVPLGEHCMALVTVETT